MGGGGSFAAYEAGYVWGLINYDDPDAVEAGKYEYDIVTGTSGGSINAAVMASFPIGKEREMADYASEHWSKLMTGDILQSWGSLIPLLPGIFMEQGLVDT